MGFSKQEYWSGLPCPPPGDLPNPGTEPRSSTLQADSFLPEPPGKPFLYIKTPKNVLQKKRWNVNTWNLQYWGACTEEVTERQSKLLPRWHSGEGPTYQCRRHKRPRLHLWVWKIPRRRKGQPTPLFLPGELHGQRSLVGYSPQGHSCKELVTTERTHTQTVQTFLILFGTIYHVLFPYCCYNGLPQN